MADHAIGDWNPEQYLRFSDDRLRPSLDLVSRLQDIRPARVVDLGCGPGNVTPILLARFPGAEVVGVDSSAAMLEKARTAAPDCRFVQADFSTWRPDGPPNLIFSNAALHWVGGHETLLPRLLGFLAPGGRLAIQMPAMHTEPLRRLQYELAASDAWAERLRGVGSAPDILSAQEYWDLLRPLAASVDIWETVYLHALQGEDAVMEWASGSSLRPFLDALPEAQRPAFRQAYAEAVRPAYPRRRDGTTLLPFRRLFIVATR